MKRSGLTIRFRNIKGGMTKLILKGVIDGHTSPEYQKAIEETVEKGVSGIILDFSDVQYMSSAGVGVLIAATALIEERFSDKGGIVVVNASESIKDVFKILEIHGAFTFVDSQEEAVNFLNMVC
jgi:anti-sigma B factor antagonist